MKNKIITEGKEALERTLLMMKYDMKKTLTENVEVISEQGNEISAGDLEDFVDDAVDILDRDVETSDMQKLIDLMKTNIFGKKFKGKCAYDKFLAYYKDNESFQLEEFESEVNSTGEFGEQGFDDLKQELLDLITKEKQFCKGGVQTPASGETAKTGVFDCIPKNSSTTTGKYQGQNIIRVVGPSSMIVYWEDGHWTQYGYDMTTKKVGTETKRGTFTCESGKLKTTEGSNKSGGKTGTAAITDKNLLSKLDFSYKYPGDEKYVYAYSSPENALKEQVAQAGKWYGKNIATGKVFDITTNYPTTAAKLNDNFFTSGKAEPTTQTASAEQPNVPKKMTDMSSIELSIMKKQEPLKYNSEYSKLGAIEKKKVDDTIKGVQTSTEQPNTNKKITDMSSIEISNMKKQEPLKYNSEYSKLGAIEKKKVDDKMKGIQAESLKKSLKKNLIEAKEKKEDLMVENKIITNRFNFLFEGKSFETEEEKDYLVESIITEIGYLKVQGYTPQAINEGLFSMLGNIFGGSVKSIPAVFGEYIAGWLTKTLGIPQNSYMSSVIVALVGNLNIADYDKFFSDCRFASNKIADSLIEGYVLQLQNEKNLNTGASGFIVSALRNSVVDYFTEDKTSLIQILEDKISEFICPKLSKLSSAITDKTDDLKTKIVA